MAVSKPVEFKIEIVDHEKPLYKYTYFYEDGNLDWYFAEDIPAGLELNKHYSITDLYGYKVIDDRKDL